MSQLQANPSRSQLAATQIIDRILDEFHRHCAETGSPPTEVHIPPAMEQALNDYYRGRYDKTAREMIPSWKGIKQVHWGASAFRVC